MQKACNEAVCGGPWNLRHVPDWFVTQEEIEVWHDNRIIECYNGHQKRRAKKASIKEELMPIAWHPDRVIDWCMSGMRRDGGSNR